MARLEGGLICPEGAACVAAVRQLRESGWLAAGDEVVVLNTGTGLKYPDPIAVDVPVLAPGDPIPVADLRRPNRRRSLRRPGADPVLGQLPGCLTGPANRASQESAGGTCVRPLRGSWAPRALRTDRPGANTPCPGRGWR